MYHNFVTCDAVHRLFYSSILFQIICQTNNNSHNQDNVTLVVNHVHLKDQQLIYIYVQNIDLI